MERIQAIEALENIINTIRNQEKHIELDSATITISEKCINVNFMWNGKPKLMK